MRYMVISVLRCKSEKKAADQCTPGSPHGLPAVPGAATGAPRPTAPAVSGIPATGIIRVAPICCKFTAHQILH